MAEYERYNTRNVAQKEIYDSYMGILRISPNEINDAEIDDPTQILNTLYDEEKKQRTKIILSDSDGNVLPISFQPRAFTTTTIYRDPKTGVDSLKQENILHIATIVNEGKGYIFASKNFTNRGSIIIEKDDSINSRHSSLRILSGGDEGANVNSIGIKRGEGWVLYPTESPNDSNYFNNKNKHILFDETDNTIPRYKQVENTLYTWTAEKHETQIGYDERVKVAGKYVTTTNQFNEEIPVYYTRDYILGQYDGHHVPTGVLNNLYQSWGIDGKGDIGLSDFVTKLSWTRIDKLIWESLNEILSGQVRHHKGRYTELGINESAAPGLLDKLGLVNDNYKNNAPILGTEVLRGLIMYHAMPFHRYWYHRTRQALRGFIERKKGSPDVDVSNYTGFKTDENNEFITDEDGNKIPISLDKWILEKDFEKGLCVNDINDLFEKDVNSIIKDANENSNDYYNNLIHEEIVKLSEFYKNDRISPCSTGTVGFAHSLAKNFILCNGRNVTYANYPNLSLTNEVIFDTSREFTTIVESEDDIKLAYNQLLISSEENDDGTFTVTIKDYTAGRLAIYDKENGFIINKNPSTLLNAMILSSSSKSASTLKLPNLFALFESTPRFIRGLNWKVDNDSTPVTIYDEITKNYVSKEDSKLFPMNINDVAMQICKINKDSQREDSPVFNMVKQLEKTALPYFHTYDHLVEKESHQHHMFSQIDGGYDGKLYDLLHNYHCRNTRGGHHDHKDHWMMTNMMNYDRTFTRTDAFIHPSSYYIGTGETNGWKDTNYLYYNFNGIYKGGYFKKFTPIPNLGLLVFNASIFNNIGEADAVTEKGVTTYGERGTLKQIEDDIKVIDSNECTYFYKDGQSTTHYLNAAKITPINGTSDILGEPIVMEIKSHEQSNEEDDDNIPQETITDILTHNSNVIKYHDAEKQRRKFMAMKMNEAEGFIPISYYGKASGYVIFGWSRDERRGTEAASRNTYHDEKYNVASYIMAQAPLGNDRENYWWRCWSSIAYLNHNKLGVGDVEKYIENRMNYNEDTDYYDINSVTQLPDDEKYRNYKYGGVGILVDETCPSPVHQNFLPLIRI